MLDEFRSTLITWDKATSRIYSPVTANESDENGRKLVVQIVNGGQVEDLTGATLHLYWITRDKAHDGLDVFDAVDLKKGEFELSYTTGMLSNQGALNANLVLIDTVGRVVSERFKITVTEGIDNDAIQSENSFSSLTQALVDISNLEQNYAPRLNDLTAQLQQTVEKSTFEQFKVSTNQQLEQAELNKVDKGGAEQVTFAMLSQDAKTAMTGGSVAVVGVNGVSKSNIIPDAITKNKLSTKIQSLLIDQYTNFALTLAVGFYGRLGNNYTNAGYLKQEIPVTAGDVYKLTGYSYFSMPLYVLVDSVGAVVSAFPTAEDTVQTKYTDVIVTIPNGVVGLRVNKIDNASCPLTVSTVNAHVLDGTAVTKDYKLLGKQLYNDAQNVSGFWIAPEGVINTNASSKYAKIPVTEGETVSLCRMDARSFNADQSGALLFFDANSNIMSFINPSTKLNVATYNGYKYITFVVPTGCVAIGFTTKLSTTHDITATLLVVYGDTITQDILDNNQLFNIDGLQIVDKQLRATIDAIGKKYFGKKWVVVGDSLTEKNIRATLNYYDYVSADEGFTVINMGRSGTGYMRTWDEGFAFYQRILAIPTDADVVTVFGSFNDLGGGFALGTPSDTGTTTICGCMNTFFDNYYSVLPTTPIGVVTPTPWVGNYPGIVGADNYVNALIEICKKRSIPYLDLFHGSNLRPWDAEFRTLAYSKDDGNGVHPDETGHKLISAPYREFVKRLI